jgi:hypothetical protein
MSDSEQFKPKYFSHSKKRFNIMKNMTGMSHPAFQSNNTVKKYINQKLNIFLKQKINRISKNQSFNFNENLKQNKHLRESFVNESSTNMNLLSNFLNINVIANKQIKMNESNLKHINNSYIDQRYFYNKRLLSKQKEIEKENLQNENIDLSKNNYLNSPICINKIENKTTPINFNKNKSIYNSQVNLNNNLIKEKQKRKLSFSNNKSNTNPFNINQNNNRNNNTSSKNPSLINRCNQIELLKGGINEFIYKKEMYNNIQELNNSHFLEKKKKSQNNNYIKLFKYNNNDSFQNNNCNEYDYKNKFNKSNLLKNTNTINLLLKTDESYNENKCPVPMPYVKKYTIEDNNKENINLDNILINKFLKEPEEEKNIPSTINFTIYK